MSQMMTDILKHILWYNFNFKKPESSTMSPAGKANNVLVPLNINIGMESVYITEEKCYLP